MWNTSTFVMELLGTLILSFGIYSTIKVSSLKSFSFKGTTRNIFIALGIALSYVIAVYVAANKTGKGFVNPATALMASIRGSDYSSLLPAIAGEFAGAFIGVILALLLFRAAKVEKVKYEFTQMKFTVNFHSEMLGSIIFLTGVVASISSTEAQSFSGVIVGLSAFAAMLIFGHKFVLLLNPATGLAITLGQLIENKFVGAKAAFINYAIAIFANLAVAASIGGIAYSLKN